MARPTPTVTNFPTIKIIICGPHTVYWVPIDVKLNADQLKQKLHPKEMEHSKKFKAKNRKDEFLRGRWLFHKATKVVEPVLLHASGNPKWPENTLGSITHKDGHVMFTKVSPLTHFSIGIDLEKYKSMKVGIIDKICREEDKAILDEIMRDPTQDMNEYLTLIFSAKESIFKSHFPLGKKQFDFLDVAITKIDRERREVHAVTKIKTSDETPEGHKVVCYYSWVNWSEDRFVITTTDERKPIVNPLETEEEATIEEELPSEAAV